MTNDQKIVKIFAISLAVLICVSIFSAVVSGLGLMIRIAGGFDDQPEVSEKVDLHELNIKEIDKIDIDLKVTSLRIIEGNEFSIEKENVRSKFDIRTSGTTLKIEERSHSIWNGGKGGTIIVTVPSYTSLNRLSIDQGAGVVNIEDIDADYFDFDQGAGTLNIENCTFDHTDIDGGVGKTTVRDSSLTDLDLDAGVGEIDIEAEILGKGEIDGGVGAIKLDILGYREDYTLNIEKGLGSITVDGQATSGQIGTGHNRLSIEGGVGAIKVNFKEN